MSGFLDWAGKSVLALPNTVGSGRDNTGTIPGTFVDSVTPAAPHASIPRPLGLLPLHQSEQRPSTPARPKSRISKDFLRFLKIMMFHSKMKVAKSTQRCFESVQGMRTWPETTPRASEWIQLAAHARMGDG